MGARFVSKTCEKIETSVRTTTGDHLKSFWQSLTKKMTAPSLPPLLFFFSFSQFPGRKSVNHQTDAHTLVGGTGAAKNWEQMGRAALVTIKQGFVFFVFPL